MYANDKALGHNGGGMKHLPDLCFVALVIAFMALCYFAPSAKWVVGGYVIGVCAQWCIEWKTTRASLPA